LWSAIKVPAKRYGRADKIMEKPTFALIVIRKKSDASGKTRTTPNSRKSSQ